MKLYIEKDLIDLVESLKDYTHEAHSILGHDERDAKEFVDIFLKNRTPIELPSDEDIEDKSLEENNDDLSPAEEFQRGAKYVINKIQGGNKNATSIDEPTEKQMSYIKSIEYNTGVIFEGTTKQEASEFISKYKDHPDNQNNWSVENGY